MSKNRTNSQKQDKKTRKQKKWKNEKKEKNNRKGKKGKQGLQEPYLLKRLTLIRQRYQLILSKDIDDQRIL